MIRSVTMVIALILAGMFAFFYFSDRSSRSAADKARDAAMNVGGAVMDKGVASVVHARLAGEYGLDATRFLSVHFENGRAVVYGLLPESISADEVAAFARRVPGVEDAEVLVQPRPAYLGSAAPARKP